LIVRPALLCLLGGLAVLPGAAHAAGDEIQVYTDDLRAPGTAGLEVHSNYVFRGEREPGYPGERAPDGVLHLTFEPSFGINDQWDWGFYIPLAWDIQGHEANVDGVKLRVKWLHRQPGGGDGWFWGENVELAYNTYRASPAHLSVESRTIVGVNHEGWQLTLNPVLGVPLSDSRDAAGLGMELDLKLLRELGRGWSAGIEHYADFGLARDIQFGDQSDQSTYLALDWAGQRWDFNVGVGHGWTQPSDKLVLKAIVGLAF
jgi:hypothetical protein